MAGGNVIVIESEVAFNEALEKAAAENKAVVVDFYAQWCGPCKIIAPYYETLSTTYTSVVFLKVDVDVVPSIAEKYNVSAMPTFLVIKNKEKAGELVGASKEKLDGLIKDFALTVQ